MVKSPKALEQWNRGFLSQEDPLPYEKALQLFTGLWKEATHMGILPSRDPMEGIETDIKLAKILNSCSKKSSLK